MKLYHFTRLAALVGDAGLAALQKDSSLDAVAVAVLGSILKAGLQPNDCSEDYPGLPPCVWLTSDPNMPPGFSSYHDWRVTVDIDRSDSRLKRLDAAPVMAGRGDDFWFYLGSISVARIEAVDRV